MTPRDRAILRAVQQLGDNADLYNIGKVVNLRYSPLFVVGDLLDAMTATGIVETYVVGNLRYWRLTRLGEAAIEEDESK